MARRKTADDIEADIFGGADAAGAREGVFNSVGKAPSSRRQVKIAESKVFEGKKGWYFRDIVPRPDGNGTHKPTVFIGTREQFPTRTTAINEALVIRAGRHAQQRPPGGSMLWQDFCDWYRKAIVPSFRDGSRATTKSVMKHHIEPRFLGKRTYQIDTNQVQEWIDAMRDAGATPETIRHRVNQLKTMLNAGRRRKQLSIPVIEKLYFPKAQNVARTHEERTFTDDESARLIEAAPWPYKLAFAVNRYCGLRVSETPGLEWKHLDLDNAQMLVAQQALRGEIVLPKTKDSVSTMAIPSVLLEMFQQYCAIAPKCTGFLFTNKRTRRPLTASAIRSRLYRLCDQLGIRRRGPHAFRRCFADALIAAGAQVPALKEAMRHTNWNTTVRYVSSARRADVTDAIERAAQVGQRRAQQ